MADPILLFWNQMETLDPASQVGPGMYHYGTHIVTQPGKFGNGLADLGADTDSGLTSLTTLGITAATSNWTKFTIEGWINTTWNMVDGYPDTGMNYQTIFVIGPVSNWNGQPAVLAQHSLYCHNLGLLVQDYSGAYMGFTTGVNWTANAWHHIAAVWNLTGIAGGSDTVRIYVDGAIVASSTTYAWSSDTNDYSLGLVNAYPWTYSLMGTMDNVKIWDEKTDFSDRFFEGDGITTGVTASKGTYTDHVVIIWNDVAGDSLEYQVSRSDTSGGTYTSVSSWQSGTNYSDYTVTPGTTYYYEIKSRSSINNYESALSAYDSGYAGTSTTPDIPTGLAATSSLTNKITLTWDSVTGPSPTYQVYKSNTLGGTYTVISSWISGLTYDDTSVIPYQTYYYEVQSKEGGLESGYSSAVAGMALPHPILPPPPGITASTDRIYDVRISWDAEAEAISYVIYRSTVASGPGASYTQIGTAYTTYFDDTNVTIGITYYYRVGAFAAGQMGLSLSSAFPGYAIAPLAYSTPTKVPAVKRSQPEIVINGFDIYRSGYVAKMFNVTETKTFARSKLIFNDFNLDVNNFDDTFSRDNPKSIFYGKRLYLPVQIFNRDGMELFNGVTLNLTRDHVAKTASIEVSDTMATYARTKIEYQTSTGIQTDGVWYETPAMAVKNIMDKYGASDNYDLESLNASDALYVQNSAYIKCQISLNANTYLTNFIEKLAEVGCADAYIHKNRIRFDHWKLFTQPAASIVNIGVKDLLAAPKVSILFSEVVNDYRVRYTGDGGIATQDSDNNNIGALSRNNLSVFSLPEIRASDNSQVSIRDKHTAVYFGECLIRRTHTNLATNPNPLQVIDISLPIQDREWLDITSHFALTFPEEGWDRKIFEIMGITFDEDANKIDITAYEISS